MSRRNRSSEASTATMARSAVGCRIASWIALKPPHEIPHIPTAPFDHGCAASQAMTASPSASSWSLYSPPGSRPSLRPVPRMSTRAPTYPRSTRYGYSARTRTLVLERREIVGGACVTEEIAPGVRASTTSYIASMLRPEVIRDLRLADHGLRMVPCDPGLQVPFLDGEILPWWTEPERTAAEIERLSATDSHAFVELDVRLKRLARYLQPFFLEPPPDVGPRGLRRLRELGRVGRRLRGITGDEVGELVR